jgi:peptidoglycan/LPS O-acetylase OafA/YrhL
MSNQPTATRPTERSTGIDNLRVFITLLVLAFHAALAHTTFAIFDCANYLTGSTAPIIDNQRWIGFDIFFAFNNTFFMSLMFFISGLFVYKSLEKKDGGCFCRIVLCVWASHLFSRL